MRWPSACACVVDRAAAESACMRSTGESARNLTITRAGNAEALAPATCASGVCSASGASSVAATIPARIRSLAIESV